MQPIVDGTADYNHLLPRKIAFEFFTKHVKRIFKRLFYNYFLRDFNVGTLFVISALSYDIANVPRHAIHNFVMDARDRE